MEHRITKFLLSKGFMQSKSDYSLFTRVLHGKSIHILVYVDDLLISGDDKAEIVQLKAQLHDTFTIKDLGLARYFLGSEIARSPAGTTLNQRKFILDILQDSGMAGCKPAKFLLPRGLQLLSGAVLLDPEVYRSLVGRLLYLTLTWPDISYVVQHLSQFLQEPKQPHLDVVVHVL